MEDFKSLRKQVEKITVAGEIDKVLNYKTVYGRFSDTAKEMPNSIAMNYMGNKITYKELLNLIDTAAKGFAELGIGYDDVVTMSALPTPYGIASFYALDKLGAVSHLINSLTNIDEIKRELSNFKSKYFIGNDLFCNEEKQAAYKSAGIEKIITISLLDCMPKKLNKDKITFIVAEKAKGLPKKAYDHSVLFDFDSVLELGKNCSKRIIPCEYKEDKMASVAYTSGSTGNSKACVATWKSIDGMVQVIGMTEDKLLKNDVAFVTFPLWIFYSMINMIHEPMCLGATLAFDPLFKAENFAKRNKQYEFNHWQTIPPYVNDVVALNKKIDCSKWKRILTGGDHFKDKDKIAADEYVRMNGGFATVEQGYGATECMGGIAYPYYENPMIGSVGKPCIGNLIKIIDEDTGKELGVNETGVGYFYSPALMKEYYGDEEATKHNLVPDENGVLWYNTEDLIHINENGEIFLDGRIRRIVLTFDENGNPTKIIPDKLKKVLSNRNDIDKCEVITIPDDERVNVSVAYIVPTEKSNSTDSFKSELIEYSKANVPEYMVPKDIVFLNDIPLTSSRKPDLKALEKMYLEK